MAATPFVTVLPTGTLKLPFLHPLLFLPLSDLLHLSRASPLPEELICALFTRLTSLRAAAAMARRAIKGGGEAELSISNPLQQQQRHAGGSGATGGAAARCPRTQPRTLRRCCQRAERRRRRRRRCRCCCRSRLQRP